MRTLILLPVAVALIHAIPYAAAQTLDAEPTLLADILVRPVPGQTYKPTPLQVAEVKGEYTMDNGETLTIPVENRRLYARIGQRAATELVPIAENNFASGDQRMFMEFKPIPFGDQVVLTYSLNPDQGSASSRGPAVR